ncbi:hypothetical protein KUTeg_020283, partial [Tegillarca granosa]
MASASSGSDRLNTFIYQLPFSITREICMSLDIDKLGKNLHQRLATHCRKLKFLKCLIDRLMAVQLKTFLQIGEQEIQQLLIFISNLKEYKENSQVLVPVVISVICYQYQNEKMTWRVCLVLKQINKKFRHENIVPLYGYALDGTDICLVYQFMPNGSLEDRLRCKVMYEVCTGEKAYDEKREGSGACFLAEYIHELLEDDKDKCLNLIDSRDRNCPKEIFKRVFDQLEQIENDYRTKYGDKTSAKSNYQSLCTGNTESQEPEALMLQKIYDGACYPPNTPETADCNDFKNPFYYPSNPEKLEEIRKYEAEFKSKNEVEFKSKNVMPKEMTPNFTSFKKEYEIADDGHKIRPGTGDNTEPDQNKTEKGCVSDKENMISGKGNITTQNCAEKCKIESGGPGNITGSLSHDISAEKTQQECDSQKNLSQVESSDDSKQACVVQAASAEENEKLKQTRDNFLAKYEELIQQGGGMEDYEYEGDEFGEEISFFDSDFDTVKFQNSEMCDTEGFEAQNNDMTGNVVESSKFDFTNNTSGGQTESDSTFSHGNMGNHASALESQHTSHPDVNSASNIDNNRIRSGPSYKIPPNTWKYKKAEPSENIEQY